MSFWQTLRRAAILPAIIWLVLFILLPKSLPDDPRNGMITEITDETTPEIGEALDKKNIAVASAQDLVAAVEDEVLTSIAEGEVSLKNLEEVSSAIHLEKVSSAIQSVLERGEDLRDLPSIRALVADSLAGELLKIPGRIASEVDTPLTPGQELELVEATIQEFLQRITDGDVSLDQDHESDLANIATDSIEAAVEGGAATALGGDVTALLAGEVVNAFIDLDSEASEGIGPDSASKIALTDQERVASEVADELSDALKGIVEQIVKSDIDPRENGVVESIVASIAEESFGAEVAAAAALDVAGLLQAASLEVAQAEGPGALNPLRNALSAWVGRAAITAAGPWILFTFLWKAWADWDARRFRRNEPEGATGEAQEGETGDAPPEDAAG